MKALSILSLLAVAAVAYAAPVISPDDVSEETLKGIGTDAQKASLERHRDAVKKAEKEREDSIKEAKEVTAKNNSGLKKTIQKRHLNTMLPPCEREPEAPREPGDYTIRF